MQARSLLPLITVSLLVSAAPARAADPFTDMPQNHWAADAVGKLREVDVLRGYRDGSFGGRRAITRYEAALAINRFQAHIIHELIPRATAAVQEGIVRRGNPQGPAGARGPSGPQGEIGATGPQGPAGEAPDGWTEFQRNLDGMRLDVDRLKSTFGDVGQAIRSLRDERARTETELRRQEEARPRFRPFRGTLENQGNLGFFPRSPR